ncbi:MAG: c-type cytochrome [Geminicoccaceae bacterium]
MRFSVKFTWLAAALCLLLAITLMATFDPKTGLADENAVDSDNPLSGDEEAIAAGRKTYNTFCAQCHGVEANGHAPRFGKYSADLRKFNKGFYEFAGIVVAGVPDKQMPPWGDYLDGDQISEIGAYLETLAIDGAKWAVEE